MIDGNATILDELDIDARENFIPEEVEETNENGGDSLPD